MLLFYYESKLHNTGFNRKSYKNMNPEIVPNFIHSSLKQSPRSFFLRGDHIILRMCKRFKALLHYHHFLCLVDSIRA